MDKNVVRCAVISTDRTVHELLRELCATPGFGAELGVDITVPFAQCDEDQLRRLREYKPDLIVLDLADDAELGIRLAQFIFDSSPSIRFLALGPVLEPAMLMNAMRAGVADYLPKPVTAAELQTALERATSRLGGGGAEKPRAPGKIYSFFSPKGGGGSTTIATNLAIALHRLTEKRVLLVDLDLELGEIAVLMGAQPKFSFIDLVQNFHRLDSGLLASYIDTHSSGVHLLSAPFHPERAEAVTADQIRRILQFLRQHYDYVLVDTSKSFAPATLAVFERSDLVFLVTTIDLPSIRNIQRALPLLRRMLPRGDAQIHLVVNRYQETGVISLEDVENTLGIKPYWTLSNDYEAVMHSVNAGRPIVLEGKTPYARDVKALAADLAGIGAAHGERPPAGGIRTFFSRRKASTEMRPR